MSRDPAGTAGTGEGASGDRHDPAARASHLRERTARVRGVRVAGSDSATADATPPGRHDPAARARHLRERAARVRGEVEATGGEHAAAVESGGTATSAAGPTVGAGTGEGDAAAESADGTAGAADASDAPPDVQKYDRFKKVDGAQYERVNDFLRERTYVTAREWAIARLCADFRTETGVEMTKIGENLPELVPFMTEPYSPQAVNQARSAFEDKVRKAGATFLYGAMCDFLTADELDDVLYEATEVAKFLLEVEGVELSVDEELAAEDRISTVMRDVRQASDALRHEGVECPHCGESFDPSNHR